MSRVNRSLSVFLVTLLSLSSLALLSPSAAAESGVALVHDSFGRSVANGWGSPDTGPGYVLQETSASSSVSGGAGLGSGMSSGSRTIATLPVSVADVHVQSALSVSGSSVIDLYHTWRVRVGSQNRYDVTLRANSGGSVTVGITRIHDGKATWLSGARVPAQPANGSPVRFEAQVTGSNPVVISARAWQGSTTPAYQVSYKDASSDRVTTAGSVALDDLVASTRTPVKLAHDELLVEKLSTSATPTPAPVPTPAPAPAPPSGRGTVLGSQTYTYPSDARFVAPGGDDSASGSKASPYRTVAKALSTVAAGGTIVLRAGNYHESLVIDKRVTVQNYPNEVAWFDGSRSVDNWVKSGSSWVSSGWTAKFSSTMGGDAAYRARFISPAHPMAAHPDQLFVDGHQLDQVGSLGEVKTGTFFVDERAQKVYLGSDPSGKNVRLSDLAQALKIVAADTTLRGIGVRRYATPSEARGAVQMDARGGTFRHLVITDNATIGLAQSNHDKTVDHVVVTGNGMMGVGLDRGDNFSMTNSVVSDNDSEHFKPQPVSAGVKITNTNTLTVKNNDVSKNNEGLGIWLDVYSSNFIVASNTVVGNGQVGIEAELSANGIIANNEVRGSLTNINVYDSENVKVYNNELGEAGTFGIKLSQSGRWKTAPHAGFNLKLNNIVFANNVVGCGKGFQYFVGDGETNIPADKMALTITGNLFSKRVVSTDPTMVAWGLSDNRSVARYETPAALSAAKNSSWRNSQSTTCASLDALAPLARANASLATAMPTDVASAVGVPTGTKVVGNL